MKTTKLVKSVQLLSFAFTCFAALLVAGVSGCNSDSSVPEASPPPAMDPAEADTEAKEAP